VPPLPSRTAAAPPPPAAAPHDAAVSIGELTAETARVRTTDTLSSAAAPSTAGLALAAPDGVHRWRIREAEVERSVDAGATWTVQRVSGGPILAGAAPSATVAWLVGRAGTVLRTVDGTRWERLPFPELVTLVRVAARSQRDAEVTTADGRTFLTSDGGQTWRLRPPG
jgi:photosystem II stability/assembly factor-like uncharacterized protein